jgi:hypothetical protein
MSQPNRAHSIHERLLKVAKAEQEEFRNLMRYARERFVLQGARLFALWSDEPHRLTQDLDLPGFGGSSIAELETACQGSWA